MAAVKPRSSPADKSLEFASKISGAAARIPLAMARRISFFFSADKGASDKAAARALRPISYILALISLLVIVYRR